MIRKLIKSHSKVQALKLNEKIVILSAARKNSFCGYSLVEAVAVLCHRACKSVSPQVTPQEAQLSLGTNQHSTKDNGDPRRPLRAQILDFMSKIQNKMADTMK